MTSTALARQPLLVSEASVSSDLYELSRELFAILPDSHLLGEPGYGVDYSNDVFEMHPEWWGDCECGYAEREAAWEEAHRHAPDCYQTALEARDYENPAELAEQWGLALQGCALHCTCGQAEQWTAWLEANPHPHDCPTQRPNFRHRASGVEVCWYNYIGRGMKVPAIPTRQWRRLIDECLASLDDVGTPAG